MGEPEKQIMDDVLITTLASDITLRQIWLDTMKGMRVAKLTSACVAAALAFLVGGIVYLNYGYLPSVWATGGVLMLLTPIVMRINARLCNLYSEELSMHVLVAHINNMDEKKLMKYASAIGKGWLRIRYKEYQLSLMGSLDGKN